MYVCICHKLSTSNVESAIDRGADDVASIYTHYGKKKNCGLCIPEIKSLLKKNNSKDQN